MNQEISNLSPQFFIDFKNQFASGTTYDFEDFNQTFIVDKWIAWKEIKSKNTRYGLRASMSLSPKTNEFVFYVMMFSQDINGSNEEMTDVVKCNFKEDNLIELAHNAIKNTGILFDTKNYCAELTDFLSDLHNFDKNVFSKKSQVH